MHYVSYYRVAIQTCTAVYTVLIFRSWKLNVSVTKTELLLFVDNHLTWGAFSIAQRKMSLCKMQLGLLNRQCYRGSSVSDAVIFVTFGPKQSHWLMPDSNHWLDCPEKFSSVISGKCQCNTLYLIIHSSFLGLFELLFLLVQAVSIYSYMVLCACE